MPIAPLVATNTQCGLLVSNRGRDKWQSKTLFCVNCTFAPATCDDFRKVQSLLVTSLQLGAVPKDERHVAAPSLHDEAADIEAPQLHHFTEDPTGEELRIQHSSEERAKNRTVKAKEQRMRVKIRRILQQRAKRYKLLVSSRERWILSR